MSGSLSTHPWEQELDWRNDARATRDLIGEPAHLIVAIVAMVMEPLGQGPATVGFWSLVGAGVLRAPVLIPIWRRMCAQTWVKLLIAWILFSALSIAWSPSPVIGVDRLWSLKAFAWLPLLWPLHRHWKWLLGGFLLATAVMQGIQISGEFFHCTYKGVSLATGLRHPTMTGLYNGIALSCWLFLSVSAGWRVVFLSFPMAALSTFGFFWANQRAAVVGIIVELIVANIVLATVSKGWIGRAVTRGLIAVVLIGCVYLVVGERLETKFVQVSKEATASLKGDAPEIVEGRIAMWKLALAGWAKSPIFGVGLGGYRSATANIEVAYKLEDIHNYDTPHSTYIMILTESGIIGLALFLAWTAAFFVRAIGCLRIDTIRIGAFGGTIIWFSAAATDSFHTRGVFLTIGVIMMALAVMPVSARTQRI